MTIASTTALATFYVLEDANFFRPLLGRMSNFPIVSIFCILRRVTRKRLELFEDSEPLESLNLYEILLQLL